ncbi:MAG: hypothetical protein QOK40_3351 [Miltoncostaeaceae bacterium]|nr:hypothetical protein [Miltoncostaeaceae bacterium]
MSTAIALPRGRMGLRLPLTAAAGVAALLGAAGVTQRLLFTQPSALKYLITVLGPLVLLAAAAASQPLLVLLAATIVAAPFAGFTANFGGLTVSPLIPLLLLCAAVAVASGPLAQGRSALAAVALPVAILLALPLVRAGAPAQFALLMGALLLMAWLSARAVVLPGGLAAVLGAVVASAALQAGLAIWQFRTGHRLNLYDAAGQPSFGQEYFFGFGGRPRPTGSLYDPISLGNLLALACPAALALACTLRAAWARIAAGAAGALVALGLTLSLSRMSWIGAALGMLVAAALMPAGARLRAGIALGGILVVALVVGAGLGGSGLGLRLDSILSPTASTTTTAAGDRHRLELWQAAGAVAEEHPVLGVGFDELSPQLARRVSGAAGSHAHSTYLQILAESGLAGLLALGLALGGLGRDLKRGLRRRSPLAAGLVGSAAALLAGWLTDYTMRYLAVAAMAGVLFGAAAGLARANGSR